MNVRLRCVRCREAVFVERKLTQRQCRWGLSFFPGIGKERIGKEKYQSEAERVLPSAAQVQPRLGFRPAPPCPYPTPFYSPFAPPLLRSARLHFALCSAHSHLFRSALRLRGPSRLLGSRTGFLALGSVRLFFGSAMWSGRQSRLKPVGCVVEELRCRRREREAGAEGQGRREDAGGGTVAAPLWRSGVVWYGGRG